VPKPTVDPTAATTIVQTEVPLQRVADLLCSAMESGGIAYWACVERTRKPRKPIAYTSPKDGAIYPLMDYPLCKGGAVILRDTEDEKRALLVLDFEAIQRGLALMPVRSPRHWADFVAEDSDANTADVFVQLCVFGEVIYG
jgi:hypothetical protein